MMAPSPALLDAALERNAYLAARLRHVAAAAHQASGHVGVWHRCTDPQCTKTRDLLERHEAPPARA